MALGVCTTYMEQKCTLNVGEICLIISLFGTTF